MSDITEQRFVMGGHSPEADSELHKIPVLNDEEELIEMSEEFSLEEFQVVRSCLLYTSPSPRDA